MNVVLNAREHAVLQSLIRPGDEVFFEPLPKGSVRLNFSDELADELRDRCAEKLDTSGFDASYEPNELGELLEALIDKLFVE